MYKDICYALIRQDAMHTSGLVVSFVLCVRKLLLRRGGNSHNEIRLLAHNSGVKYIGQMFKQIKPDGGKGGGKVTLPFRKKIEGQKH